jgi:hypothetical protein
MEKGASPGKKEAVSAAFGRAGEIADGAGRVRKATLSISLLGAFAGSTNRTRALTGFFTIWH